MRWAGWAAMAIGLWACGGGGSNPGGPGGGSQSNLPPDGGSGDGGVPAADAGPSPDCIGIVPSSSGPAYTFDVPATAGQACLAATSDGMGIMAAEVHTAGATPPPAAQVQWFVFGTNGGRNGSLMA